MTLLKEDFFLDGVTFLKVSPGTLKIRPDFQSGGLLTLPYSMCALNDHLCYRCRDGTLCWRSGGRFRHLKAPDVALGGSIRHIPADDLVFVYQQGSVHRFRGTGIIVDLIDIPHNGLSGILA